MDYRKMQIVFFVYQLSVESVVDRNFGTVLVPPFVMQRTKLHSKGLPVHITQYKKEKELIILPFFTKYYESLLGKELAWKDPHVSFIQDIEIQLQRTDAVCWIFVTSDDLKVLEPLARSICSEVCVYSGITEDIQIATLDFPNDIAA